MAEYPIGTARIDIRVDDAQVAPALERGRAAVNGFAGAMRNALAPARALAGAARSIGAAVGAVTAVVNAFRVVSEYIDTVFGDGVEKAREFGATLTRVFTGQLERDVKSAAENVEKLKERLAEVNAEIAWAREHPIRSILEGRSMRTMQDEAGELRRMLGEATRFERALAERLSAEKSQRALSDLLERLSDMRWRLNREAWGFSKEEIEYLELQHRMRKEIDRISDPDMKRRATEEAEAVMEAWRAAQRRRQQDEDEQRELRIEKEREAAERIAREQAEAIGKRIRESLVEAFDLRSISTTVDRVLDLVRIIASSPRRMM